MPTTQIPIGNFNQISISGFSLPFFLTGGSRLTIEIPETFLDVIGNTAQTGRHRIQLDCTFISDGAAYDTLFSQFSTYSATLLNNQSGRSISIPTCYITKRLNTSYTKTNPSLMPVSIIAENRDLSVTLYTRS